MGSGQIAVFGSSRVGRGEEAYQCARRLGRLLAEAGYAVCSGGYGGIMEAVSRGAREAGGIAIGVTVQPWSLRQRPNAWLSREVEAPHLFDRLRILAASDAYVALPGGLGTFGEVAVTWNLFQTESIPLRPLILVGSSWRPLLRCLADGIRVDARDLALLRFVDTVEDVLPILDGSGP
jgi:uncharacterized protein (TIGR00730 family)